MKCKIQWVDPKTGNLTPDDNDAVGMAVCYDPVTFGKKGSDHIPICKKHFEQLLLLQHWKMLPLPKVQESIRKSFKDSEDILSKIIYHPLDNYWSFNIHGMFVGIEQDGYIHT
jgi:hypothetical protein